MLLSSTDTTERESLELVVQINMRPTIIPSLDINTGGMVGIKGILVMSNVSR